MPGFTRGSPTAPSRIASHPRIPSSSASRQRLARAQVPVGAQVELDQLRVEAVANGLEDLEALGDDLGAGAVAADDPDPVRSGHGATSGSGRAGPCATSNPG